MTGVVLQGLGSSLSLQAILVRLLAPRFRFAARLGGQGGVSVGDW